MQIESKKKKLCLEPLRGIITQGEKMADTVTFRLPATYGALILSDLSWQIRAASEKNTLVTADLATSSGGEFCLVQWEVSADFTAVSGALSLMLVGTDSEGNVVIKFPGDDPIWIRDAETGQYSPPEDAIQKALNGLQQAQASLKSAQESLEDAAQALQNTTANFRILGHYDSLPELQSAVTSPSVGDAYGVGDPTAVYVWNGSSWAQLPGVLVSPSLPMSVANGGTGGTTVTQALANLGAQASNNLLVNPRMIYNSRDKDVYTGAGYSVDGWWGGGDISVATSSVGSSLTSSGDHAIVKQLIKTNVKDLNGKPVTLSISDRATGSIVTCSATLPSTFPSAPEQISFTNTAFGAIIIYAYVGDVNGFTGYGVEINLRNGHTLQVGAVKFELGSVSTLQAELDNPPPEDVEKLKLDMYDLDPGRCAYLPWHNENLLDNWYFVGGGSQQGGGQFPINQRGQTSYTAGDYQYCIDRWLQDGENVTFVDNGIKIEAQDTTDLDNKIYQCIENVPHNVPLTFSAIIDNKLYIVQGMSLTRIQNIVSDFIGVEIGDSNGYQYALIRNTRGSITIQAVKLEKGYLSTLARKDESGTWVLNDPPPNFQQELAKCQRYQIALDANTVIAGRTYVGVETRVLCFLPTPVTMRINPTWVGDIENIVVYSNGNTYIATSIINVNKAPNGIVFTITISSGVGVKQPIIADLQPGAIFDANL